jgi:hypothetical protein
VWKSFGKLFFEGYIALTCLLCYAGGRLPCLSGQRQILRLQSQKVKVDGLKFSIRESKRDVLSKTLQPLVALVNNRIQKAIRDSITMGMENVDEQLVGEGSDGDY